MIWNMFSVVTVYNVFLALSYYLLPGHKLMYFAFLAMPGVFVAICDAADVSGAVAGWKRYLSILGGVIVAVAVSLWFLIWKGVSL